MNELNGIKPSEAIEIVNAWYPWWSKDEVFNFLSTKTLWPLISNDTLRKKLVISHLDVWDQYVSIVEKNGYEIDKEDKPRLPDCEWEVSYPAENGEIATKITTQLSERVAKLRVVVEFPEPEREAVFNKMKAVKCVR